MPPRLDNLCRRSMMFPANALTASYVVMPAVTPNSWPVPFVFISWTAARPGPGPFLARRGRQTMEYIFAASSAETPIDMIWQISGRAFSSGTRPFPGR